VERKPLAFAYLLCLETHSADWTSRNLLVVREWRNGHGRPPPSALSATQKEVALAR
jgi:hypothetical protein